MDVKHFNAFLVVAEELHFGRAAERLHMTQPPVSRLIRNLERDMSVQLFERSTRTVRLTAAGEALIGPARDILMSYQLADAAVTAAGQGEIGHLRLGFTGIATHTLVGRLSKLVRNTHPGIHLSLQSSSFALPAMASVADGTFDLAFGHYPFVPQSVETRAIAEETLVVAVHNEHPLADRESVSMAELASEDFITLPPNPGSTTIERLYTLAQAAGFSPQRGAGGTGQLDHTLVGRSRVRVFGHGVVGASKFHFPQRFVHSTGRCAGPLPLTYGVAQVRREPGTSRGSAPVGTAVPDACRDGVTDSSSPRTSTSTERSLRFDQHRRI